MPITRLICPGNFVKTVWIVDGKRAMNIGIEEREECRVKPEPTPDSALVS